MYLTPEQLQELQDIVARHHAAFVANYVSPSVLPDALVARLKELGLIDPQAQTMRDAYLLGIVAASLPPQSVAGAGAFDYGALKRQLAAHPVPLSPLERHAIGVAQLSAGQYIVGLGSRVAGEVGSGAMAVDAETRASDRAAVTATVTHAIAHRRGVAGLASDLGHATKDWARNLKRVANTELANAYQEGSAQAIGREHGDQARVAKMVAPDACNLCKDLYLEKDETRPKIFTLAELTANGSNVGRKAAACLPVVGATHPNCGCTLVSVPDGMAFNDVGQLVAESRS